MTATLTKWYEEHGRHEIFAGGKSVELADDRAQPRARSRGSGGRASRRTSTSSGIAKNAREEKLRARDRRSQRTRENERMAALYRQHVLKEAAPEPVIKIAGLGGKKKPVVQDVVHKEQQ